MQPGDGAGGPLVDYREVADRYDTGRAPSDASLDRWGDAVTPQLPAGPAPVVVDVGSGTGLFSTALVDWGAACVLAAEPSPQMRRRAAARSSDRIVPLAARATRLPLAARSADVVWLSAVLHHLGPLRPPAVEFGRVLRPGGRLLVRGFFPDHSRLPWLDHLPGAERARARFPTTRATSRAFRAAGLTPLGRTRVAEPGRHTRAEAAAWIERMRTADSLLTALSDEEVARGVTALRRDPDRVLPSIELSLLTFERPGRHRTRSP